MELLCLFSSWKRENLSLVREPSECRRVAFCSPCVVNVGTICMADGKLLYLCL